MSSDDAMSGVRQLLDQELLRIRELEDCIAHYERELLLCKGRVSAYQGILLVPTVDGNPERSPSEDSTVRNSPRSGVIGSGNSNQNMGSRRERFPANESHFFAGDSRVNVNRTLYNTNSINHLGSRFAEGGDSFSGSVTGSKKRAQRAPKLVMDQRKHAVIRAFFVHGDCSPKELENTVNEELGYVLASHRLRAVLKKFKKIFENRPQHGIWGLTEAAKVEYSELSPKLTLGDIGPPELEISAPVVDETLSVQADAFHYAPETSTAQSPSSGLSQPVSSGLRSDFAEESANQTSIFEPRIEPAHSLAEELPLEMTEFPELSHFSNAAPAAPEDIRVTAEGYSRRDAAESLRETYESAQPIDLD